MKNPIFYGYGLQFSIGVRIVETIHMTDTVEDWSDVRSPSRAARRRRQGHKQRIKFRTVPKPYGIESNGVLFVHPETARQIREMIKLEARVLTEYVMFQG